MPEIVTVTLPEMGESVTEGSIVEWRVKPGDYIEEGATLVDVTTDKVDVEVPATASGVVASIGAAEGETIAVGGVLASIDTTASRPAAGANGAGSTPFPAPPAPVDPPLAAPPGPEVAGQSIARSGDAGAGLRERPGTNGSSNGASTGTARVATHRAKRLAERTHIDWTTVRGSGPSGLVVLDDVAEAAKHPEAHRPAERAAAPAAPALPPVAAEAKVSPLKGPAGALVGYMEQSLTIPTATSFRTFAVSELERRRAELNAALKAAGRSEKVSFTHLIAFALVRAAVEVPAITATFRRENGTASRVDGVTNLGLAVDATRKDGSRTLVVPVIKNAQTLDFVAFRAAYEDLVVKARDSKLSADELSGASFTLTNPGGIGTVASVPRLMAGQGAIIAAGAIGFPPGLQNADPAALKTLGVEKILTLTSTYDHRVIQGAQSGEYLRSVEQMLGGANGFYEAAFTAFGLAPKSAPANGAATNGTSRGGTVATSAAPAAASTAAPQQAGFAAPPRGGTPVSVTDQVASGPREHENYSSEMLRAVAAGMAIVSSYRRHGHLGASLDPLGTPPIGDPALDVRTYNLTPSIMAAVPANVLRTTLPGDTLAAIVPALQTTYSSTIAYEVEHIANIEQREWLRDYVETGRHRGRLAPQDATRILGRLTKVETFERYLRKTFIGSKTFSIEGLDVMIPMLEEAISLFAEDGIGTAVIGMAHRGRLSTIAHVVNRPYEELLAEFEAGGKAASEDPDDDDATGDVKYHHGATGTYRATSGREIAVVLANNPSHLEAVDGVVEGRTRALQTHHEPPAATQELTKAAPILIHGDAAFSAQGIVAEVLNLQALRGYATGGTVHVIANNQVGFTTDPFDGRSTRYASDLAKGFDVPIVHVNADDVDACMAAVRLAVDFRRRFGHDVIIDVIGYRRFGHNETDEPAYTQPDMYERIKTHPTVRELYAQKLIAENVVTADEANALIAQASSRIGDAHRGVKAGEWHRSDGHAKTHVAHETGALATGVPREQLLAWNDAFVSVPAGFTIHPKLARQLERRKAAFANDGEMDYGLAESLAFASLLTEGTPIRLTGQDVERGTFSHRHLVFHDPKTGAEYTPMQHLPGATTTIEIHNSPLSEYACLGFEYGYSVELPNALVLWEAQFGDFMNGAQIIIDQFIAAGHAKWNESSRLALLLPHGYEGAGPEHSSARIERFLQLSAESNIRIANPTTAAQYFHLLRLQARSARAIPLVVFTPKSLLRLKLASGTAASLTEGSFQPVIDDARYADAREKVTRIVLCSGKIYYDLVQHESYAAAETTAIVRLEQLTPLPVDDVAAVFHAYPNLREVLWAQEEPMNMGARAHVRRRLMQRLPDGVTDISYVGRPYRASPSEGYGGAHAVEQERIVREALALT